MNKRSVSSTTVADDIDDGCVQGTKALITDEEHDDQNRKGGYHEGDKDGVHMRNQSCGDAGVIDDSQNKMQNQKQYMVSFHRVEAGLLRIMQNDRVRVGHMNLTRSHMT